MKPPENLPLIPVGLCKDNETGKSVLAFRDKETSEVMTIPAGKFYNSDATDVTGIWFLMDFLKRFQVIKPA